MIINSEQEMIEFGKTLAIKEPTVYILTGDLGAGKTQLTKGIALGLGITEPIISPTFTLARFYPNSGPGPFSSLRGAVGPFLSLRGATGDAAISSCRTNLLHIDLYRLMETKTTGLDDELEALGVDEHLGDSIIVIEWGSPVVDYFDHPVQINIETISETERKLTINSN
jgi:tRNA threonylcarbamoyladenosine biosynthesis protein TsaE